jgi:protein-tyrosine phosphatase
MGQELAKLNFRDIGGLPAAGNSSVRHGVIYRSEGPASFEAIHERELAALGIRLVCDLRAETERERSPNAWAQGARLLNIDVNSDLRASPTELLDNMQSDRSIARLRQMSVTNYSLTVGALRPRLRELVQAIVDGETPVLIHCTAGKDRTGVLVALILRALGVTETDVIAEYLRSEVYARNLWLRDGLREQIESVFGFLPDDEWIDVLIGVDEEFIRAALDAVANEWGTIDEYFAAAGIDDDLLRRFRQAMTVPL